LRLLRTDRSRREAIAKDLPDILGALLERARQGDTQAAKLLLDRVLPPMKASDQAVVLPLGGSLADAGRRILEATGTGHITPDQASRLLTAVGGLARIVEVDELLVRVDRLEQAGRDGSYGK